MKELLFQSMSIHDCQLRQNQIDIWQFSLRHIPPAAFNLLNQEEQSRARRFYFLKHQRRFIIAHATMRSILAAYLSEKANDLVFAYNTHGKPSIAHPSLIEFNLTHSKDLALLAVGQTYPLGIDLEFFSKRPYEGIAENLFSEAEIKELAKQPLSNKEAVFFQIWSQKEAFIKACGMGLAYPTSQFSVPIFSKKALRVYDVLHDRFWNIASFKPARASAAALCYDTKITSIRKLILNPLEFLKT